MPSSPFASLQTIPLAGDAGLTQRRKDAKTQRKLRGTGLGHQSVVGNLMPPNLFSPCGFAPLRLCVDSELNSYLLRTRNS
jgi:hypothetical protein